MESGEHFPVYYISHLSAWRQRTWEHEAVSMLYGLQLLLRNHLKHQVFFIQGARCSSVVSVFAHGAMSRRFDPLWDGPIELFLVPASASQLV